MPNGERKTKKEHFVPQVYLRGFSPEYKSNCSKDKHTIYSYDLIQREQLKKAIPIKSVCHSRDLYEVTGVNGEIVLQNYIEKCLSRIEKMFSDYRMRLEGKAFYEENYKCSSLLSSEEKAFWITYILIQLLRSPSILTLGEKAAYEVFGTEVNANEARNMSRVSLMPFFKIQDENSIANSVLGAFYEPIKNMKFRIGIDKSGKILTSDFPVHVNSDSFPCDEYKYVVFPITSKICLFLIGSELNHICPRNVLFDIDDSMRESIIKSLVITNSTKMYSNHLLDEQEKKWIDEAMKAKENSESVLF